MKVIIAAAMPVRYLEKAHWLKSLPVSTNKAHTDNESAQHSDSGGKNPLTNVSCAPDGITTSDRGIHWISRPTLDLPIEPPRPPMEYLNQGPSECHRVRNPPCESLH